MKTESGTVPSIKLLAPYALLSIPTWLSYLLFFKQCSDFFSPYEIKFLFQLLRIHDRQHQMLHRHTKATPPLSNFFQTGHIFLIFLRFEEYHWKSLQFFSTWKYRYEFYTKKQSTDEIQLSLETWFKLLRKFQAYVLINTHLLVKLI